MTESLAGAAAVLRAGAQTLARAGTRVVADDPGGPAFGSDGPGRHGALGMQLYRLWRRSLDARAREAVAHGVRLDQAADALAQAAAGYADAEAQAAAGYADAEATATRRGDSDAASRRGERGS